MRSTWTSTFVPGQHAPDFLSITQTGEEVSSTSLKGSKYILFFYNHDGSETCTKEVCNIRDHYAYLQNLGYTVIGVSEDSMKKHQKFIAKYSLPYNLISDEGNKLAKTFDIYGPKEFMGRTSDAVHRTTFIVDDQGVITAVIHPVDSARHASQIINSLHSSREK